MPYFDSESGEKVRILFCRALVSVQCRDREMSGDDHQMHTMISTVGLGSGSVATAPWFPGPRLYPGGEGAAVGGGGIQTNTTAISWA